VDQSDPTSPPSGSVKGVIPRLVTLLRHLSTADIESSSASELAAATEIPLQTVVRLLGDLREGGLVLQDTRTKRWTLGPLALTMGAAAQRQISWVDLAHQSLQRLTAETKETSILTAREGASGTHVDIAVSPQPLRLTETVGLRRPLTTGGSRRVILAFLNPREREQVLRRLEEDGVVTNRAELERQIATIRENGYAVSRGEVTSRTVGVAVPIMHQGSAVASIMVAGPDHRMPDSAIEWIASVTMGEAERISTSWGDGSQRLAIGGAETPEPGRWL
jgi:DNA-binding IclR family transcriptional regulator